MGAGDVAKDMWARFCASLATAPVVAQMHEQWQCELRRAEALAEEKRKLLDALSAVMRALPDGSAVMSSEGHRVLVPDADVSDPAVWASLASEVASLVDGQRRQSARWTLLFRLVEKVAASMPAATVSSLRDGREDGLVMADVSRTAHRISAGEELVVVLVTPPAAPRLAPLGSGGSPSVVSPLRSGAVDSLLAQIDGVIVGLKGGEKSWPEGAHGTRRKR